MKLNKASTDPFCSLLSKLEPFDELRQLRSRGQRRRRKHRKGGVTTYKNECVCLQ